MSTNKTIDPEVHAILAEVVADSKSTFFGRQTFQVPDRNDSPVSGIETYLTAAERKLVTVYRHELAQLLLEKVQHRILDGMREEGRWLRYHSCTRVSDSGLTPGGWLNRSREFIQRPPHDSRLVVPIQHLASALPGGEHRSISTTALASASLSLAPRETTRVYLGLALDQEGCQKSALAVLAQVLEGTPDPLLRSIVHQNIGMIMGKQRNTRASMACNRDAALVCPGRGDPAMSWFADALFTGDPNQAKLAASVIADSLPPKHQSIDEFLHLGRFTSAGRLARDDSLSTLESTLEAIENHVDEQAWRIGNEIINAKS